MIYVKSRSEKLARDIKKIDRLEIDEFNSYVCISFCKFKHIAIKRWISLISKLPLPELPIIEIDKHDDYIDKKLIVNYFESLSTLKEQLKQQELINEQQQLFFTGKLYYQQLLKFYGIKYNCFNLIKLSKVLTINEWQTKTVNKEAINKLNIKCSSNKLSKILIKCGLNSDIVSLILSANITYKDVELNTVTKVRDDKLSCKEQGDSIHFNSCQRTDNANSDEYDVDGDLVHIGKTLFLWTIGEPMSVNKEGFISRAKLRVCFDEEDNVTGLFIDRIYGNSELLINNINELNEWWTDYCYRTFKTIKPIYSESAILKSIPLLAPSSHSGYQDTFMNGKCRYYESINDVRTNTLCLAAYLRREKVGGVYIQSIKDDVNYNPQKGVLQINKITRQEPKTKLNKTQLDLVKWFIKFIGKPESKISVYQTNNLIFTYKGINIVLYKIHDSILVRDVNGNMLLEYYSYSDVLSVYELNISGFAPAEDIPYDFQWGNKNVKVVRDIPEYGYMKPESLPYEYYNNCLEVTRTKGEFIKGCPLYDEPLCRHSNATYVVEDYIIYLSDRI